MTPCNTCRTYKLPEDFPLLTNGKHRHVCHIWYEEYLDKQALSQYKRCSKRVDASNLRRITKCAG